MSVRFAIIGFGAITDEIVRTLAMRDELEALAAVLVRPEQLREAEQKAAGRFPVVDSLEALRTCEPDIVAECAGHGAVRQYGPAVVGDGMDFVCSSVGALADRQLAAILARSAGGDVLIPSGAIAGIDGLLAARTAGLQSASYTSAKPPLAWKGTPGERLVDDQARKTFFEGTAREAALAYPKNVNIGATVAFAGLGLDRTRVRLVSDPQLRGPLGIVEAEGAFGAFRFEVLAYASPHNPKTSLLTAHSILAAMREGVCFSALPMLKEEGAKAGR
jgi:aspartate dehydrogenase